jgi:hypothetical protein
MYRNNSTRQLAERVAASMDQPINLDIDISGLEIDYSLRTLIVKCYQNSQPFALSSEDEGDVIYMVFFFPSHGCAIWCDGGEVNLISCKDAEQFEKTIKAALIAHRKFVGIRQLQEMSQYKEICEQLKQIGCSHKTS